MSPTKKIDSIFTSHDPQIHNLVRNSKHVLSMLGPSGIIIMHDRRPYFAEHLELILKGIANKEWKAESLGRLLKIANAVKGEKGGW